MLVFLAALAFAGDIRVDQELVELTTGSVQFEFPRTIDGTPVRQGVQPRFVFAGRGAQLLVCDFATDLSHARTVWTLWADYFDEMAQPSKKTTRKGYGALKDKPAAVPGTCNAAVEPKESGFELVVSRVRQCRGDMPCQMDEGRYQLSAEQAGELAAVFRRTAEGL